MPPFSFTRDFRDKTTETWPRSSDDTLAPHPDALKREQIKRATRTRKIFCILSSVLLFISLVFLIMVEIGNIRNMPVLRSIWFINLNLSQVIPTSVPSATLLNTIAQTIGLHDFYTVGLWNYCEGYLAQGVTACSKSEPLYWFNPVGIIVSQLIAGATIPLPASLTNILHILEIASKWMFGLFLTGTCLTFVMIFVVLASVYSRWLGFFIMLLTLLNAIFITAASVIATAVFIIMRNAFSNFDTVHITATVGTTMFALMWTASACAIFAWIIQLALTCCCASRRDVRTGRKTGSKKAYESKESMPPSYEEGVVQS